MSIPTSEEVRKGINKLPLSAYDGTLQKHKQADRILRALWEDLKDGTYQSQEEVAIDKAMSAADELYKET